MKNLIINILPLLAIFARVKSEEICWSESLSGINLK